MPLYGPPLLMSNFFFNKYQPLLNRPAAIARWMSNFHVLLFVLLFICFNILSTWIWFPQSKENSSSNLFTLAVGIKQRDIVDEMVKKVSKFKCAPYYLLKFLCFWFSIPHYYVYLQFLSSNFTVMLFHYDGVVDEWKDYKWNDHVIHVSARNQTKW